MTLHPVAIGAAATDGPLDRLDAWEGRSASAIARQWKVPALHLLRTVGSTNDVAKSLASMGAAEGTIVLAEEQNAGRGRAGRVWSSSAGLGLYLSIIARPQASVAPIYPLAVAIAVARALDPWTEGGVSVKWPNDLLIEGRKLGGILCEATWSGGALTHLVVGIGLNILHRPDDFPPELRASAASLLAVTPAVSRFDVASAVVASVTSLIRGGGPAFDDEEWRAEIDRRDALRGRQIDIFETESGRLLMSGMAEGIADDGSLTIRQGDQVHAVRSGTVRFRG